MRIVKTQKILYNREFRIRLIADNEDADFTRLVRKLPDCKWSNHLNSWHTHNIQNHVFYLNKSFPSHIRFYDISNSRGIPVIIENQPDKQISIHQNNTDNSLVLRYLNDHELTSFIKKLGAVRLSDDANIWQFPNDPDIYTNLNTYLEKANYLIEFENQPDEFDGSSSFEFSNTEHEEIFREKLIQGNYEKRTIEQYVYNLHRYLKWAGNIQEKGYEKIRDYIDELSISRNLSRSYQNQQINSIKAYYYFIYGIDPGKITVQRPKKDQTVPAFLSRQEAEKLIRIIPNQKHKALISIIYMTGITVGETVSIKPWDIDKDKMQIFIRGRKDNRGRNIALSDELLEKIELYRNNYHPQNFLFEGYNGSQYSERSIQKALKKYVDKAGINKKTSTYTLRHSFAGRLVSEGIDIGNLQQILGHVSRKSTEIYSKVFKINI